MKHVHTSGTGGFPALHSLHLINRLVYDTLHPPGNPLMEAHEKTDCIQLTEKIVNAIHIHLSLSVYVRPTKRNHCLVHILKCLHPYIGKRRIPCNPCHFSQKRQMAHYSPHPTCPHSIRNGQDLQSKMKPIGTLTTHSRQKHPAIWENPLREIIKGIAISHTYIKGLHIKRLHIKRLHIKGLRILNNIIWKIR